MKKSIKLLPYLLLIFSLNSCLKNDLPIDSQVPVTTDIRDLEFQSENFGSPTQADFIGVIKDENLNTLEGVQIRIGNLVGTTDRNGVFVMNDVDVFENFAYIRAEKAGYVSGSRVVIPKENGVNRVEIQLLNNEPIATIQSGQVSEVDFFNVKVTFPGNFITKSNGSPYNGPVSVVAHYLRPNSGSTFFQMPGTLFAQTASNEARSLETYGMVSVDLYSASNEPLNIDPDFPATLEFPVDFSQNAVAPETIPLWSFDEEVGYWKEEGEARKENNKFIGQVSHFSWWNIDYPMDLVELCFTLNPSDQEGSGNYLVALQRTLNDQYLYYGYNTSEEAECGWIPRNESVQVEVYAIINGCANQLVHEETVGGFSNDTSVTISFTNDTQIMNTQITGTVTNCNGTPLSNGYLYVDGDNISSIINGIIDVNVQHCSNDAVFLQVFDSNTGQFTSTSLQLNGSTVDVGTLSTCEDTGGIYNGNVILESQRDVEDFAAFNYTAINGNLLIQPDYSSSTTTDITDLSQLTSLQQITGRLNIGSNNSLQSLNGLSGLTSVDRITISNNQSLTSVSALENLESLTGFSLHFNPVITNLNGLEAWDFDLRTLTITRNASLSSVAGLYNLTLTHTALLEDISSIATLEGFNFASELETLQIKDLDNLTSLVGLENVVSVDFLSIGGNDNLESLDGLENLLSVRGFWIGIVSDFDIFIDSGNPALRDYCAVRNLFTSGTYIDPPTSIFAGTFIENNVFNPSIQDIIDGNCSL